MKNKAWLASGIHIITLIFALAPVLSKAWSGPNYFDHWESSPIGFYHYGDMQIQPSFLDNGYYYAQGSFTFYNGEPGTVTTYTPMGLSKNDSRYLTAYLQYQDIWSLDQTLPKVTYTYSAIKVPQNSDQWPW